MPEVKNREEDTDGQSGPFPHHEDLEGTEVWLHTFLTYIEVNLIS
jgi:hypothetical protein